MDDSVSRKLNLKPTQTLPNSFSTKTYFYNKRRERQKTGKITASQNVICLQNQIEIYFWVLGEKVKYWIVRGRIKRKGGKPTHAASSLLCELCYSLFIFQMIPVLGGLIFKLFE